MSSTVQDQYCASPASYSSIEENGDEINSEDSNGDCDQQQDDTGFQWDSALSGSTCDLAAINRRLMRRSKEILHRQTSSTNNYKNSQSKRYSMDSEKPGLYQKNVMVNGNQKSATLSRFISPSEMSKSVSDLNILSLTSYSSLSSSLKNLTSLSHNKHSSVSDLTLGLGRVPTPISDNSQSSESSCSSESLSGVEEEEQDKENENAGQEITQTSGFHSNNGAGSSLNDETIMEDSDDYQFPSTYLPKSIYEFTELTQPLQLCFIDNSSGDEEEVEKEVSKSDANETILPAPSTNNNVMKEPDQSTKSNATPKSKSKKAHVMAKMQVNIEKSERERYFKENGLMFGKPHAATLILRAMTCRQLKKVLLDLKEEIGSTNQRLIKLLEVREDLQLAQSIKLEEVQKHIRFAQELAVSLQTHDRSAGHFHLTQSPPLPQNHYRHTLNDQQYISSLSPSELLMQLNDQTSPFHNRSRSARFSTVSVDLDSPEQDYPESGLERAKSQRVTFNEQQDIKMQATNSLQRGDVAQKKIRSFATKFVSFFSKKNK